MINVIRRAKWKVFCFFSYIMGRVRKPFNRRIMDCFSSKKVCSDIDGVLCRAPSETENDYGPNYEIFLKETHLLLKPPLFFEALISGRLETYRSQTENWLKGHNIHYKKLIMRPNRAVSIVKHKSKNYKKCGGDIFIEDELSQAREIFFLSKKPVFCINNWKLYKL